MRIVHLTDPHLATPPPWRTLAGRSHLGKRYLGYLSWWRRRRLTLRPEWLGSLTAALAGFDPDQILLSGDLAQIGTAEEIRQAGRWLTALAPAERISLVPGNHDVYAADSWPAIAEAWHDYLPEGGYPLVRCFGDVAVFGLSTAVPTAPFSATGCLGSDQLERLRLSLAAHRDAFRVVLLHHPPLPNMIRARKRLIDAPALASLLEQEPVQLVLHGHDHRNRFSERSGARIYCTAPASAEAASFRTFEIERDRAVWTVRATLCQRRDGSFEAVDTQTWRVSAPG